MPSLRGANHVTRCVISVLVGSMLSLRCSSNFTPVGLGGSGTGVCTGVALEVGAGLGLRGESVAAKLV
jgi:hypothetical protein